MAELLVIIPIFGSVVIGVLPLSVLTAKRLALLVSVATFWVSLAAYATFDKGIILQQGYTSSSLNLTLSVDGISLPFIILTAFLTPVVLVASWNNVRKSTGAFVSLQLLTEGLLMMVFGVSDLFAFYAAFEAVLIPLFITVGVWGAKDRVRSAFLLFIFTLSGSLFMLLALLALYVSVGSCNFSVISAQNLDIQSWIFAGIFLAFCVKTPIIPFHMWLPRAHADAPLAASMVLAGTVLKIATYGYARLCLGLLPVMSAWFAPLIQALAVISVIFSSFATIRQSDVKALIAYSSIGHMAVVVLGLFSGFITGIVGAMLLSIAHGFVSPALFVLTGGVLYDRYHSRIIVYYRGLGQLMPVFSSIFFIFTIINMGQPLSLNWIGEFLAFSGIFCSDPYLAAVACSVQVLSAAYAIWLFVRISAGSVSPYLSVTRTPSGVESLPTDVSRRECWCLLYLLAPTIIFGIWTAPLTELIAPSLSSLMALAKVPFKIDLRSWYLKPVSCVFSSEYAGADNCHVSRSRYLSRAAPVRKSCYL